MDKKGKYLPKCCKKCGSNNLEYQSLPHKNVTWIWIVFATMVFALISLKINVLAGIIYKNILSILHIATPLCLIFAVTATAVSNIRRIRIICKDCNYSEIIEDK